MTQDREHGPDRAASDRSRERWLEACRDLARTAPPHGRPAALLGPLRSEAIDRFAEAGLPTSRDEEWRFTNVAPIARLPFRPAGDRAPGALPEQRLAPLRAGVAGGVELVFVDGRLAPELSAPGTLPDGVRLTGLARALEDDSGWVKSDWLEPHLGRLADPARNAFVALNAALFRDGAFLYVPRGVAVEAPIHLLFLSAGGAGPVACHPRSLLVLGEGAQATVVETHASPGSGVVLASPVTEAVVGPGGVLDHSRLLVEDDAAFHVSAQAVRLERGATLRSRVACLGGALVRNDLSVVQGGTGMDATLDGLYLASGDQHVDNHTAVDHAHPHGASRELYKGMLDDRAHGVFNGRVLVREGAQKTDARQSNRNLLLSADARIDTKPELQIFADDVRCSHGATIGQIDEAAAFYLRSRGLDARAARSLLMYAFASEIVARVPVDWLRARLHDLLLDRLPGGSGLKEIV